jgi:GT2 family glycosyltransferase
MQSQDLPSFSVVIPTHNRPRQLRRCLAALAALDYPRERFEVIVVDDASPTRLNPLVDAVQDRVRARLVRQQRNAGPAAARNAGAAHADGELIAFTDDDCAVDPGWLRAFAHAIAARPDSLHGGRVVNALRNNFFAETSQLIHDTGHHHFNVDPADATFFASNNMACAKSALRSAGGFDEAFRASEDRELCDRWRRRGGKLAFVPDALIHHAHDLTLGKFWRQHFSYGQGAWRYHTARAAFVTRSERNGPLGLNFRPDLSFYTRCLHAALSHPSPRGALSQALLIGVWQLANTSGFFWERTQAKRLSRLNGAANRPR